MKRHLLNLISWVYTGWVVLIFLLPIPIILLVHIIAKVFKEGTRLRFIFRAHRIWIAIWEWLTGIHFRIQNADLIDPNQSYVFIVNHVNLLDILMVGSCIQHPIKFLAKKEILKIPFVGWIIQQVAVMVDRSNKESRSRTMLEMKRELNNGVSILVFPEGTRNRTPHPLKTFYPGGFRIALTAGVPILPVVITNSRNLQPVHSMRFFPGKCEMTFLSPISTENMKTEDVKALSDKVRNIMEAAIRNRDKAYQTFSSENHSGAVS